MKLFLNIKESARERHWDTYNEAKKLFDVIEADARQQSSVKIYAKNQKSKLSKVKTKIIENFDLINYQKLPKKAKEADLVYVWGSIPKTKKEYIIELDNPYVVAYYNAKAFHNKLEKIKEELSRAKKITFLSNAAKNHFLHYFGDFKDKCFVNYPFMKKNYLNNKREKGKINFIFVGLDFERKGGLETLEAFNKVSNNNMKLYFISNVPENIKKMFKKKNIEFIKPVSREKLFNEIYPKMDIFIMPTLYESFGVVFLEALSFGMGIIGTNVYATSEMIVDNYNGKLLHHPFIKPKEYNEVEIVNCTQKRIGEFNKSYRDSKEFYYSLYSELKNSIKQATKEYNTWQENSIELYEEKFSEEIWRENFRRMING